MLSFRKKRIIKTEIGVCDYSLVCSKIETSIIKNSSLLIFPLATHTLIKAYFDKKLQNILNTYDILTPDSQWIKWSLNLLYRIRLKERVYGPDLMLKVLGLANKNGYPIFLYGTNTKTLKLLINKIKKKYPKLNIAGSSPAPYGDIDIKEQKKIVNEINKSTAKIVFIALSSPKQVILAKQIADLNKKNLIYIPVGVAFDFIAGTKKQAPKWMQNFGLEWLFRLMNEPFRLWKRYIVYGPIFIGLIISQKQGFLKDKNIKK